MYTENRLTISDSIWIDTPSVDEIQSIQMRVLSRQALWIELASANLDYLANAVRAQIVAGGVVKKAPRGKKHKRENVVVGDKDKDDAEELVRQDGESDELCASSSAGPDAEPSNDELDTEAVTQVADETPAKTLERQEPMTANDVDQPTPVKETCKKGNLFDFFSKR